MADDRADLSYLGAYQGVLLIRQNGAYFHQSDDGAPGPKWCGFRITKKQDEDIIAMGRMPRDMVFGANDEWVSRGVPSGGVHEAVINPTPLGDVRVIPITRSS